MVLGLYQQAVIGFFIGICILGFTILWVALDIRNKLDNVLEVKNGKI